MKKQQFHAEAADFLRVFCIFIIGWYHIWQQSWLNPNFSLFGHTINIYPVVTHGYMLVDIMLLISGFLLTLGWLSGRYTGVGRFYLGRIVRIAPAYLLCILILFIFDAEYSSTDYLLKDLLSHLTFTHNLLPEGYNCTQLNTALWTLAVEMQFYLLFPAIIYVFKRKPILTYLGLLAISALSKLYVIYFTGDTSLYINRLPAMLDVYANGMLAAWLFIKLRDRKPLPLLNTMLMLIACVGVYHILKQQSYLGDPVKERLGQLTYRFPLSLCGAVFLVCGSRAFGWVRAALSNPVTRFLGAVSYGFYLWHGVLAVKLKEWRIPCYEGENPNMTGQTGWQYKYTLLCFAAALLAACISYFIIEKPFQKKFQNYCKIK